MIYVPVVGLVSYMGWSIIYSDICTCCWAGQLYIVIYVPVVGLVNYI